MAEQSSVAAVRTSPSRLTTLTNKIVSLVASPLRQSSETLAATILASDVEAVDEEIFLRGRGHGLSAGMVGVEGADRSMSGGGGSGSIEPPQSSSLLALSHDDQFYTPIASEGTLERTCAAALPSANLSSESVPTGFSQSFSAMEVEATEPAAAPRPAAPQRERTESGEPSSAQQWQEFDPVGLIVFDSPNRLASAAPLHPPSLLRREGGGPQSSLLDLEAPSPASPTSVPKYSERDLQLVRGQFEERLERQTEFLHFEISSLQEKYTQSLRAAQEMKALLGEYERTMGSLVETRKVDPDRMSTAEQVEQERQRLLLETQSLKISFTNLRLLYDETKRAVDSLRLSEQSLLSIVSQLKRDLAESQKNYDSLLSHAQSRMNDANEELHRLRTTLEIELSANRAKLHKSELRASSLEGQVESKTRENSELMTICDELIQKIDSQAAAAGNPPKSAAILSSLNIIVKGSSDT